MHWFESNPPQLAYNVISLCAVAKFVTAYFRLKINVIRNVNVNLLHNLQYHKTSVSSCLQIILHLF